VRLVLGIALALVVAPGARADIGVRLDRTSGRPGEWVVAQSAPLTLPLYLVPSSIVPPATSCHNGTAICEPTSLGAPRRPGWTWLGRFFPTRPRFRFRVPSVAPGPYRPVIYCAPCVPGPRGSLLAGPVFTVLPPR
jgi:hypothetical protein